MMNDNSAALINWLTVGLRNGLAKISAVSRKLEYSQTPLYLTECIAR